MQRDYTTEEEINRIQKVASQKVSQAKRIRHLLLKLKGSRFSWHLGLLKKHRMITDFKEPIMLFMRETGDIEFYEDVSEGRHKYKHSNGEDMEIILSPNKLHNLEYGNKRVKCYIAHENFYTPLPEQPVVETETIYKQMMKIFNDMTKWKITQEQERTTRIIWWVMGILGVMLIGYLIYQQYSLTAIAQGSAATIQVLNQTLANNSMTTVVI